MPQVRFLPSWYFNSQPHKEADMCFGIPQGGDEISTHSLTRRLTHIVPLIQILQIFQLTASQGG